MCLAILTGLLDIAAAQPASAQLAHRYAELSNYYFNFTFHYFRTYIEHVQTLI